MAARTALVVACLLGCAYVASAAAAPAGVFVKANIVDTWGDCPVKAPKEWDPKVFNASLDALTELSSDRYASNISKTCQDKLLALADCASDNDAFAGGATTSLSTSDGCCLKSCADSIGVAIKGGCFDELLKTSLCTDPDAQKYKTGIFNAGIRCANYVAECPPAGAKTNATAPVPAKPVAAAKPATAAPAAAPAPAKAGAAGAAATALVAGAGAAALLLAL